MATGWEIYCYWNVDELSNVFNAIAGIVSSGDYIGLVKTISFVMILSLAFAALASLNRMGEFWSWLIMLVLFNGILLVPKTNVILVDKTNQQSTTTVANVPFGIALLGHSTSKIGDWLTDTFESIFSQPGQLPRPKGRSLCEQAGLTRESGSQSATFATGR
jgi:conjugal transfer mating pair stabilization protein TraG